MMIHTPNPYARYESTQFVDHIKNRVKNRSRSPSPLPVYLKHQILNTLYTSEADGLCGNDDAGQMSAWYVLSTLGFYSVTPGSPYYVIGSPSTRYGSYCIANKEFHRK